MKTYEDQLRYSREWKKRNRNQQNEYNTQWRKENPDSVKNYNEKDKLMSRYGITVEQRDQMILDQQGACPGCMKKLKLVVDHCHDTGQVRCMFCRSCNTFEGLLKKNMPEVLHLWWFRVQVNLTKLKSS